MGKHGSPWVGRIEKICRWTEKGGDGNRRDQAMGRNGGKEYRARKLELGVFGGSVET